MGVATESAVIVTIPAVEEVVASHRARFDRAAGWGVPAHVTVLYPFVPPSEIDTHVVESLADAVASVPHFDVTCGSTKWFGSDMLWLDPQPVDCFRALTRVVLRAFPAHLPYGGAHDEVIPHLTVGHDASESQLLEAERQILHHLPIVASVRAASLWCGTDAPGSWRPFATLPLG